MTISLRAFICTLAAVLWSQIWATAQEQVLVADLRAGSCEASGEVVASLTPPTVAQGAPIGAARGVTAATSYSEVALPYETLLATEHVLTISNGDDVVACGAVGGIQDVDGSLVLILTEQDESGVSGIAFLAPPVDPTLATVSLFLDPGDVAEEPATDDTDSSVDEAAADTESSADEAVADSPQEDGEVLSQGLGLPEVQFGELYGTAQDDIMGNAYPVENGRIVAYKGFGFPVSTVERVYDTGVSYEDAVAESKALMPADAVFQEQYVSETDLVVDVYASEWLKDQFPNPDEWTNAEPGVFIVVYGGYNPALGVNEVTRWVMATGNNP